MAALHACEYVWLFCARVGTTWGGTDACRQLQPAKRRCVSKSFRDYGGDAQDKNRSRPCLVPLQAAAMPVLERRRKVSDRVRRCQAIMMNYMCMKHNDTIHSNSNSSLSTDCQFRTTLCHLAWPRSEPVCKQKEFSIQKPGWHGAAARPRESNEPQQDASRVELKTPNRTST